jgi:hypothetical protein
MKCCWKISNNIPLHQKLAHLVSTLTRPVPPPFIHPTGNQNFHQKLPLDFQLHLPDIQPQLLGFQPHQPDLTHHITLLAETLH